MFYLINGVWRKLRWPHFGNKVWSRYHITGDNYTDGVHGKKKSEEYLRKKIKIKVAHSGISNKVAHSFCNKLVFFFFKICILLNGIQMQNLKNGILSNKVEVGKTKIGINVL